MGMSVNKKQNTTCARSTEVTSKAPLFEDSIATLFPISKTVLNKLRSKPIATNAHTPPYTVLLKEAGLNRNFVLRFQQVNVRNYREFLREPERFLTLVDMCVIHSATGISIDRQIQVLLYGLTESELTRKGSRLIGSLQHISTTESANL